MPLKVGYFVKEAGTNLRRNKLMTMAAILTAAVSLLLLGGVLVRGRGPASGRELDPPHAHADAARGLAEERPRAGEVADLALAPARLVPVRDAHQGRL